jgi:HD domain
MARAPWAEELARDLLADELPRRWRHVTGVAARAEWLAASAGPALDGDLVVASAWLHDIGYAPGVVDTGLHALDGARHLRLLDADEQLVNLVAHHSCAYHAAGRRGLADVLDDEFPLDPALPHDELLYCDQTTDPDGAAVDVAERRAEVRRRAGGSGAGGPAEAELVAVVRRVEARYGLRA